jgi:Alpha/beta hydrolase domain
LGGTFSRFSDAALESRYQSRYEYVERVRRAADRLVQQRYILDDDRDALIDRAEKERLPF